MRIFNAVPTSSFVPSLPSVLVAGKITLDFKIPVETGDSALVEWFLEYAEDPNEWFQEVAEDAQTGGAVAMPIAVRTFNANGGGGLAGGAVYRVSTQFLRHHKLFRIQLKASAGTFVQPIEVWSRFDLPVRPVA
jgi:hypothetical protein